MTLFDITTSKVVRMPSLLTPIMDNIYLDTYYFFVPNRLCWSHWRELMGENTQSAWIPTVEYQVPQITAPAGGWNVGTIADYFGIPTGVANLSVNAMPFRAYSLICNEWFRDENLTDPLSIPVDDATVVGVNTGNYITDTAKGGLPFKASKYFDLFSGCLPSPQKGPDVKIPVAAGGQTPVVGLDATHVPGGYGLFGRVSFNNSVENGSFGSYGTPEFSQASSPQSSSGGSAGSFLAFEPTNLWAVETNPVAATINSVTYCFPDSENVRT